jgi:hypothetical protein
VPQKTRFIQTAWVISLMNRKLSDDKIYKITRLQNYQIHSHSPAFTNFLILRLIRSRFSALMCEIYSLPFK